jgi:hypothetical protein
MPQIFRIFPISGYFLLLEGRLKSKDKVVAEYALADIEKILPKRFKSALPSIEEIERELL